jgi:hypothetical protein
MWFSNNFPTRLTGFGLAVLLSTALALPANATEMWKVDFAKSKFSSGVNTLVLERTTAKAAAQDVDPNGAAAGKFLVISNGRLYVATDESYAAASTKGVKNIDYNHWIDMKLLQIGDKVRSADHCGFRCQSGLPDSRMVLTFTANGIDPSSRMGNVLVLNK